MEAKILNVFKTSGFRLSHTLLVIAFEVSFVVRRGILFTFHSVTLENWQQLSGRGLLQNLEKLSLSRDRRIKMKQTLY